MSDAGSQQSHVLSPAEKDVPLPQSEEEEEEEEGQSAGASARSRARGSGDTREIIAPGRHIHRTDSVRNAFQGGAASQEEDEEEEEEEDNDRYYSAQKSDDEDDYRRRPRRPSRRSRRGTERLRFPSRRHAYASHRRSSHLPKHNTTSYLSHENYFALNALISDKLEANKDTDVSELIAFVKDLDSSSPSFLAGALVAVLWAATMDTERLRETMQLAETRNPIMWASLFSRNLLPGVVNVHRSTRELLSLILEGQAVPDLEENSIPVLVSAFDVTRLKTRVFSDGKAADALAASMAVPLLFKPVWSKGRPLLDGAVGDVAGVDGLDRSERVLYHHATYLPLWLTQHLRGFSDLVVLKIDGLPYLTPWQLEGNGMDAFHRAKEATLRALDAPITRVGRSRGGTAPTSDSAGSSNGGSSSSRDSNLSSAGGSKEVHLVKVRACKRGEVGGDDHVRSRL